MIVNRVVQGYAIKQKVIQSWWSQFLCLSLALAVPRIRDVQSCSSSAESRQVRQNDGPFSKKKTQGEAKNPRIAPLGLSEFQLNAPASWALDFGELLDKCLSCSWINFLNRRDYSWPSIHSLYLRRSPALGAGRFVLIHSIGLVLQTLAPVKPHGFHAYIW